MGKGRKRKRPENEKLGIGRLSVAFRFSQFGTHDSVDSIRTRPEHAAEGVVVEIANDESRSVDEPSDDNMEAAVDAVMKSEPLTRKANTNSKPGKPATKQVLVRTTEEEHEEWRKASDSMGVSMSEMVREAMRNYIKAYNESKECRHPMEKRKVYPWAEICSSCGKRLRG